MNQFDENIIREEFQNLIPFLEEWGTAVDFVLTGFIKSLGLSFERVQQWPKHRVKDIESYASKVLYRKSYQNPIKDTTDKVGTRIVLLNIDDVYEISGFIEHCDEWILVEKAQDIDYIREHNPSEFSYQSNHFIVKPKPGKYSEEQCDLLTCEIQVRTLLQHAYAETSHDTVYKKGHSDSPKVLRSLAVTMAFLETADEKIKTIYNNTKSMTTPKIDLMRLMDELYRKYVPTYSESDYDAGITEALMAIFDENYYLEVTENLKKFIEENDGDIRAALGKEKPSILFRQPVVLLAFYSIRKRPNYLTQNWPFTHDSLLQVSRSMNISDDAII